jgi:hypothetical protein
MAEEGSIPSSSAIAPAARRQSRVQRKRWLVPLLWMVFISGLVVQAFAPRLKIEHNAFVIPPAMVAQGKTVNPAELVQREKRMQLISGLLTLAGALGLGLYYRDTLMGRRAA